MVVDMDVEDLHWRELIFDVYSTHKKLHFASDHSKLELTRNVSIKINYNKNSAHILAPGSAHARPSAQPTIVMKVTFKHLLKPLRSHTQSFRTLGQLLKIPPFLPKHSFCGNKLMSSLYSQTTHSMSKLTSVVSGATDRSLFFVCAELC
jgi:hypothetical protein